MYRQSRLWTIWLIHSSGTGSIRVNIRVAHDFSTLMQYELLAALAQLRLADGLLLTPATLCGSVPSG